MYSSDCWQRNQPYQQVKHIIKLIISNWPNFIILVHTFVMNNICYIDNRYIFDTNRHSQSLTIKEKFVLLNDDPTKKSNRYVTLNFHRVEMKFVKFKKIRIFFNTRRYLCSINRNQFMRRIHKEVGLFFCRIIFRYCRFKADTEYTFIFIEHRKQQTDYANLFFNNKSFILYTLFSS